MGARVAILTDIHGNAPALHAVLADVDREGDIEQVYCLGDMISIGPDTAAVLDTLFERDDVTMLIGNHEEAVLTAHAGGDPGTSGTENDHQRWIARHLDGHAAERLRALPRRLDPVHSGQRLLLVHYHMDGEGRLLPIDPNPTPQRLDAQYSGEAAGLVCFGHDHRRFVVRSSRRTYADPGSLGCHNRAEARYALLDCRPAGVEIDLRDVPYDNRAFLASYHELGVPAADFVLKTFHGGQYTAGHHAE